MGKLVLTCSVLMTDADEWLMITYTDADDDWWLSLWSWCRRQLEGLFVNLYTMLTLMDSNKLKHRLPVTFETHWAFFDQRSFFLHLFLDVFGRSCRAFLWCPKQKPIFLPLTKSLKRNSCNTDIFHPWCLFRDKPERFRFATRPEVRRFVKFLDLLYDRRRRFSDTMCWTFGGTLSRHSTGGGSNRGLWCDGYKACFFYRFDGSWQLTAKSEGVQDVTWPKD